MGSTPARVTIRELESEFGSFLLLTTENGRFKSSAPKIFSLISKCRSFENSIFLNVCLVMWL